MAVEKYNLIEDFLALGLANGAIAPRDEIYVRNQLLTFLGLSDWQKPTEHTPIEDSLILMDQLLKLALEKGRYEPSNTEFYEAALMNFITPRPSDVDRAFREHYQRGPEQATQYFYALARQVNQVKTREIARNIAYTHPTDYGALEITINLSKPEKDPKVIAAAKNRASSSYPACALCVENEGLYGSGNQAARSNHRLVSLSLNGENWFLQYSPYAYFPEHSIVLNEQHQPMAIDARCFANLLAFLDLFPHYMIGSNADLPIVGGSILTHDHYQAGRHEFPMAKADIRETFKLRGFPQISAGIVNWPMSVLRLSSTDKAQLLDAANRVLNKWQSYSDESLEIGATLDGVLKHTITPIARKRGKRYEMDLVLRDNNVSEQHPDGIFHPHAALHHIKKENIGLIEVMGRAILPPRLKSELADVEKYLLGAPNLMADSHRDWADRLKASKSFTVDNVQTKVRAAVGAVFTQVLEDAGVFKNSEAGWAGFRRFIEFLNS